MEKPIKELDERTDPATKRMLQKVVERKQKYDKLHFRHLVVMWLTIFSAFLYVYYFYQKIIIPYSHSFTVMFSQFTGDSKNLYGAIIIGGLYGFMNVLREKRDKAEKEFHALRCEIIDKSTDLWCKDDQWQNRHLVFEMMKREYDINLFHENK